MPGLYPAPVSGMVPRAVPTFPKGHARVLPCSCTFAASAHLLRFAFVGTMVGSKVPGGGEMSKWYRCH